MQFTNLAGGGSGSVPNLQETPGSLAFTAGGSANVFLPAPLSGQLQIYGVELTLAFSVFGPATASNGIASVQIELSSAPVAPLAELEYAIGDLAASAVLVYPPQAIFVTVPGLILSVGEGLLIQNTAITIGGTVNGNISAIAYYNIV